ncbi:MAG: carbohydrate ABC transporter permease, partial [Nitrospira sp.]|nr:carbohydrate ABC transporter permease [Nitrospira sp.]
LKQQLGTILRHLLLGGLALMWMIPFYWLVITSLKPLDQVFTRPLRWMPEPILWWNYVEALTNPAFPFFQLLNNSLFYSVLSTVGVTLSCSIVAYGFARLRFRGRDFLFAVTLATLMLPGVVTLIPTYLIFHKLGLVGSYGPLVIPPFFGDAFYIFLLRQFFKTLPWELTDAARVDGAGELLIFWKIMLPLIRPAVLVVIVFNFLYTWNDFTGPLIYLNDNLKFPLSLGLYAFQTRHQTEWNLMMAAALVVTIPLITIFFVAQKQFIEGITLTGTKG